MAQLDEKKVVAVLNQLLEAELAGVIRYTHYSFFIFGVGRIPIVSWMREQATESLQHAQLVGEWITTLDASPSLSVGKLLTSKNHDVREILRESLEAETEAAALYEKLLALVEGRSLALEEFARQMIFTEAQHASEVRKMLRKPEEANTLTTARKTKR